MSLRPVALPLVLLLAVACEPAPADTDTDTDVATEGTPQASVDSDGLQLGTVCGPTEGEVVVTNDGNAVLAIASVEVTGGDWVLVGDAPATVDAGASVVLTVSGSDGDGTLTLTTDDPAAPTLSVALSATANVAPVVSIADHEAVNPPGGELRFVAELSDEAPDDVTLVWTSSEEGELGTEDTLLWSGLERTSGTHTLTLTATDACGETATVETTVCQNAGYTEETLDLETWTFSGQANWDAENGWVELTDTRRYISGTAFQTSQTVDATNVSIEFAFFVSGGSGADGMSLTAIDTTRMTSYVGDVGGGNGYGGLPGWSIEVDTWYNAEYTEPTEADHLTFVLDGAAKTTGEMWAALPEMEDGAWHTMKVDVQGKHVTVAVDDVVYLDDDVEGLTSFPAHVGFTAATGNVTNNHLVDGLKVERFVCEGL